MTALSPEVKQAAQVLGQAISNTPALRAYSEASTRLASDEQATGLLDELQRVQAEVRKSQSNGGVSPEDLARLRQLQSDVQANPAIAAFIKAEQNAALYLPQVNREISDLLGVDFATLGRVSGCC